MRVIKFKDIENSPRQVECPKGGFISYRYLLASDGMGFSYHKTVIPKGEPQYWHYKNHLEACYCINGHGILQEVKSLKTYHIKPGTMYVLDKHDEHVFQAFKKTTLLCVFNPPLKGKEVHDESGSYRS